MDDSQARASQKSMGKARERSFLEAALDAILMVDGQGRVVEFNPSAEAIFGYSRGYALGHTLAELIVPPSLRDRHQRAFDRFIASGEARIFGQRIELTGMRADGSEFPVELVLSQVKGEPLLICGAIRDVSEEKHLKQSLRRLADEQAALRQVATLVAKGASPTDVFSAVAEGVAHVLGVPAINMIRLDADAMATKIAGWGAAPLDVGSQWTLDDPSVMALVTGTGRPGRIDNYADGIGPFPAIALEAGLRSAVGAPIIVDGTTWGVIVAYSAFVDRFSDDAERRLFRFTELVAVAISNMQALDRLHALVDEQAALRRVATVVARRADPQDVFDRACAGTGQLLRARDARVVRYGPDRSVETLASWGRDGAHATVGTGAQSEAHDLDAMIQRTRTAHRVIGQDDTLSGSGSKVGGPILVEDRPWGALIVEADYALPANCEATVTRFAELIAAAVENANAHSQLLASRARIVTAGDEARRHLQRDMHDGAQQRIVASVIDLQLADERFATDPAAARAGLRSALQSLQAGLEELRELAAGLHPRVLTRGGLQAAMEAVAIKSRLPVTVRAPAERYPSQVEAAAYFVVAEGLANVAKHARASHVHVHIEESDGQLLISVEDDGVGGADPEHGSGLRGLEDRTEALGGRLRIRSVAGAGTRLTASLPFSPE